MVHTTYRRGLFTRAVEYVAACRQAGNDSHEMTRTQRYTDRLLAAAYRESARRLRETGEMHSSDPALLLEQFADELDPADPKLPVPVDTESATIARAPTKPITNKERVRAALFPAKALPERSRMYPADAAGEPAPCEHVFHDANGNRVYLYCQRGCGTRDPMERDK